MHLVDITMFYAPTSGGVRTYLECKHSYLARQAGIHHDILVPTGVDAPDTHYHRLPAAPLGTTGYRFPLRGGAWLRALCQLRPDLIEAGDPYRLAWVALAAGRKLDVPVVGFYHSDLPRLVARRLGQPLRKAAEAYIRRLYGQFDAVFAPSRVMARQLEALGVPRVMVQPLGVDVRCFSPQRADPQLRRRLGIDRDTRVLVFAGRCARGKNIDLLIATAKALGDGYHLLLIGPGMPQTAARNITTVPHYLPAPQLASHLAACDALIHAGDQETFGLVVLEAMASGLPVIGTHHGALPELVVPGTGVLTPDVTRDGLVDAARTLFSLDAHSMGRRARRRVEETYAWDSTLQCQLERYRQLLGAFRANDETADRAQY
ncbi:MAG: glycosyltransferase family 1 protein [Immundisolibacter sp.]